MRYKKEIKSMGMAVTLGRTMRGLLCMAVLVLGMPLFSACTDDEPSSNSIFGGMTIERDAFDEWLLQNYTYPYNVDFKYKYEDLESDMHYSLVPADSAKSAKLAKIIKYLWFDAYNEVVGTDFLKANAPRQIVLIGSAAYDNTSSIVLGTAEGGLKVTLYMVNNLDDATLADYETLTNYYFHTMHHEFTHILNQKIPYDRAFDKISPNYVSGDWYLYEDDYANEQGFVSAYGMSEPFEDFAEMMSLYVTKTAEDWDGLLDAAGDGAAAIRTKMAFVKEYMLSSWGLDLDDLRAAVLHRAQELANLDLTQLN